MNPMGLKQETKLTFDQALVALPEALKGEGFGILTEVDISQTLRNKLGVELRRYKVLGACNPHFASQALTSDIDIGFMLPCNVAVYEGDDGHAVVTAVNPAQTMASHDSPAVRALAATVSERLRGVLAQLARSAP